MTSATIATGQGGGRERNKKKGKFFSNFVAIREGVKKDLLNGRKRQSFSEVRVGSELQKA